MKIQLLILVAGAALLVKAQTPAEPQYEDIISNLNIKFPLDNYRPLLSDLKVEDFQPEDEDDSAVSFTTLTFPVQETVCDAFVSSPQQETPCPLKENGKQMLCMMQIAYPDQDASDITTFEMRCEKAAETEGKVRTRRSRSRGRGGRSNSRGNSRGGSNGGRSSGGRRGRPGGGSGIAGNNRGNGGTRTA